LDEIEEITIDWSKIIEKMQHLNLKDKKIVKRIILNSLGENKK